MKNTLTTASQYMVVAVTIERYVVICHKTVTILKHHYYTITVVIFSITVNIPKIFEFEKNDQMDNISENMTSDNFNVSNVTEIPTRKENDSLQDIYLYKLSSLGENVDLYLFNAVHEIFLIGFCLFVICYCNYRVWIQIVKSAIYRSDR